MLVEKCRQKYLDIDTKEQCIYTLGVYRRLMFKIVELTSSCNIVYIYIFVNYQTISHFPLELHFLLSLHKRLNVVLMGKPIISLSSCILNVNVDSCVPRKCLEDAHCTLLLFVRKDCSNCKGHRAFRSEVSPKCATAFNPHLA